MWYYVGYGSFKVLPRIKLYTLWEGLRCLSSIQSENVISRTRYCIVVSWRIHQAFTIVIVRYIIFCLPSDRANHRQILFFNSSNETWSRLHMSCDCMTVNLQSILHLCIYRPASFVMFLIDIFGWKTLAMLVNHCNAKRLY